MTTMLGVYSILKNGRCRSEESRLKARCLGEIEMAVSAEILEFLPKHERRL